MDCHWIDGNGNTCFGVHDDEKAKKKPSRSKKAENTEDTEQADPQDNKE